MKIHTANGKLQVTLSQSEWTQMGQKMGWLKQAEMPDFIKQKIEEKKNQGKEKESCEACDDGLMPDKKKKLPFKEGDEEKDACND